MDTAVHLYTYPQLCSGFLSSLNILTLEPPMNFICCVNTACQMVLPLLLACWIFKIYSVFSDVSKSVEKQENNCMTCINLGQDWWHYMCSLCLYNIRHCLCNLPCSSSHSVPKLSVLFIHLQMDPILILEFYDIAQIEDWHPTFIHTQCLYVIINVANTTLHQ